MHRLHLTLLLLLMLALPAKVVVAGGNLVQPDPNDSTQVIQTLWDDRMMPIEWVFSSDGYAGSSFTNAEVVAEFQAAIDSIDNVATSRISFVYGGEVDRRTGKLDGPLGGGIDGFNLVSFTDPDFIFPPGVVGISLSSFFTNDVTIDASNSDLDGDGSADIPEGLYAAGTIFDDDVLFNSSLDYTISGANGTLDIQGIALHEFGHFTGLSHSSVRDAVMFPFVSFDVAAGQLLKADDSAFLSLHYPDEPGFGAAYGVIEGKVSNGFNNVRVLGAHVYAIDPVSGETIAGSFSLNDGNYRLPVPAGNYLVAIEPLDGDPSGLDPERINPVVAFTFDTSFPDEFYDANEAAIEADPLAATMLTVAPGATLANIDFVTNTLEVPGVSRVLLPGRNYFAYPVSVGAGLTAYDLLQAIGDDTQIVGLERYERDAGVFERAMYVNGVPAGVDFPLSRTDGLIVHMRQQTTITISGTPDCPNLNLRTGLNIVGIPCPPAAYSAFDLLDNIGLDFEVQSVQRFDAQTGSFETASYISGAPSGDDFIIANGESYLVTMNVDKSDVSVPGQGQLFPPSLTGISPGSGVRGSTVLLLGQGFDPVSENNLVVMNGIGSPVLFATPNVLTVKVPFTAPFGAGPVTATVNGKQSNTLNFEVLSDSVIEDPAGDTPLTSGQTAQGSLASDNEQDRYVFTALQGSTATIEANAVAGGVPDMLLMLEGPSGVVLVTDDDGGPGTNAKINNFDLPETGQYTIVVTSVPGTGTGPYTLSLDIVTGSSAARISVIEGASQSAEAGTTLPVPVKVFVTGPNGLPLSGVPITFVATGTEFGLPTAAVADPINAGSATITTNSGGIATVNVTLSSTPDVYELSVSGPGITATTLKVSALSMGVATVQVGGNDQDCGGLGCEVGMPLPMPYTLTYLDINGDPVEGVLAEWTAVSGEGSFSDPVPAFGDPQTQISGASGVVSVKHVLGTNLYVDNESLRRVPHVMAVTIPGQVLPVLFNATAKAGAVANVDSSTSNFTEMTIGTGVLSAVRLEVTDQHDNLVEDATVSLTATGGLTTGPGILDGQFLTDFKTNERGIWVGRVSAPAFGSVQPTINEFGGPVSGGSAYTVTATVNGISALFNVDVNMGPVMVTASTQGDSQTITKDLASPVMKRVFRYQRVDTYEPVGEDDADMGDWRDEDFSALQFVPIEGVDIDLTVRRGDNEDIAGMGLTPTQMEGMDQRTLTTNAGGFVQTDVTMGDVGGAVNIIGRISAISVEYRNDDFSQGQDGALLHDPPAPVANPMNFLDENNFGESTALLARAIRLTITLDDRIAITEPPADPYPGVPSVSGIDLSTVSITLDGGGTTNVLFDGPNNLPFVVNKFPYYRKVFLDGIEQAAWPDSAPGTTFGPGELQLVFEPDGTMVQIGTNSIIISAPYADAAGNLHDETPSDVTKTFDFN